MQITNIQTKTHETRGVKVMLDFNLADLYQVETRVLKQAVRRNINRFQKDFMFELSPEESLSLRSQIVTLEKGKGKHIKYLPFAFIEQGVAMLSTVLRSQKAIAINNDIMRTFVYMRQFALSHVELTQKLLDLENQFNLKFQNAAEAIKLLAKACK